RRLLFSTLAVAVTAVLLFGVPLAFVLSRLQVTVAQDQVQRDAATLAKTLENRVRSGVPASLTDAEDVARSVPDRYVSITQTDGQTSPPGRMPPRDRRSSAGRRPETSGSPWKRTRRSRTRGESWPSSSRSPGWR